jgi:hypothetical protein
MITIEKPAPVTIPASPPTPGRDPRYLALRNFAMSISALNVFGYTVLGFEQPWLWPILALGSAYLTDLVFEAIGAWVHRRAPEYRGNGLRGLYEFLLPAHITALAVNMLSYANSEFWPVLFGVVVAISAKHVLRAPINGRMRHYMNPSNLGIVAMLVCFSGWVSIAPPYEFTENANTEFRVLVPMILITAGTVLNAALTRKVPLIVGWLGGFVIQALVRHWIWDVALFSALGPMSGVAFALFTNYMISDPGTTPFPSRPQFTFGASVATVYGILMVLHVVYTLFFAVAIVCLLRGLGWWTVHFVRASRRPQPSATAPASTPAVAA